MTALPINEIIEGDCLEVMRDWPDKCVDLVLTDPPYKVSQMYGGGVDADNLTNVASILRTFPEISRVLKPGHFMVCFYDNRILPFVFQATKGTSLVYHRQLFLYRRWGAASKWIGWMQTTDPILIFVNGHEKSRECEAGKWQVKHDCYVKTGPEEYSSQHPAQKPQEPLVDLIAWLSNPGELVLDPYSGSGASLFAAQGLGRKFIGIDISHDYCEIARERLRVVHTGIPVKEARAGQMELFTGEKP